MPPIKIGVNPADVDLDFPIALTNTYLCNVTSAEVGESAAKKPMVIVGLTPVGPIQCEVGGKVKAIEGKELFKTFLSLQPNALFGLKAFVAALAQPGLGWRDGTVYPEEFLGQQVKCEVSVKELDTKNDDGSPRRTNRVEKVMKA